MNEKIAKYDKFWLFLIMFVLVIFWTLLRNVIGEDNLTKGFLIIFVCLGIITLPYRLKK
ncbi:MAG: hypothetical protein UZ19_OD1000388 [Parcubacteria bacterium OLB19]|nr:MAG: hypothetical protein UZ19_OD1000388 [Parcubacteria bacterium OLB19]